MAGSLCALWSTPGAPLCRPIRLPTLTVPHYELDVEYERGVPRRSADPRFKHVKETGLGTFNSVLHADQGHNLA